MGIADFLETDNTVELQSLLPASDDVKAVLLTKDEAGLSRAKGNLHRTRTTLTPVPYLQIFFVALFKGSQVDMLC